jgi:hypothetical protein
MVLLLIGGETNIHTCGVKNTSPPLGFIYFCGSLLIIKCLLMIT